MSINEVQFIGDLTRDPAVRHSDGSGRVVSKLIFTCTWRDKSGDKQQQTDSFRIKSVEGLERFDNQEGKTTYGHAFRQITTVPLNHQNEARP